MTEPTCAVCRKPLDESASALCGVCDKHFHLNPRNDVEGKDCGEVWIDEQFLALRYACYNCLRGQSPDTGDPEPPVGRGH